MKCGLRSSSPGPRREDLGVGKLWGVVRERKGADHTLAALKSIRAARPGYDGQG